MDTWLIDLTSGGALPLMYSLYSTSLSWPLAAILVFIGVILSCLYCFKSQNLKIPGWSDYALQLGSDVIKLYLNASTLLAKADNTEGVFGAVLCIAPLFTLLSIPGSLSVSHGDTVQAVAAVTSVILVLISVWLICLQGNTLLSTHVTHHVTMPVVSCVHIILGALSACNTEPLLWTQFQKSSRRAIVHVILASSKELLSTLLRGSDNWFLWFLHGAVLLQSCLILTRSARKQMGLLMVKDPARISVLSNALLVAIAYSSRNAIVTWAPWMGVVLVIINLMKLVVVVY